MKKMKWIDRGIKEVINTFEYPVYRIHVDHSTDCVCKSYTTKQGEATCEKCLGTGQKIRIYDIMAASEESMLTFRSQAISEASVSTLFFIDYKYEVFEKDIIVDEDKAFLVHRIENKKGTGKDFVYRYCIAVSLKNDPVIFMRNFKKIVGE